uniref:Uncharacterized protein n=1 Tax=Picea glauca TaxID=3330 RepID=A0A124GMW4_PICGL|nr:hypothetical protein ABT39_MTgene6398 [Picea glauca]QHR86269.1 hypothetical protein Q903MT_gene268 [Picea sitchensis]
MIPAHAYGRKAKPYIHSLTCRLSFLVCLFWEEDAQSGSTKGRGELRSKRSFRGLTERRVLKVGRFVLFGVIFMFLFPVPEKPIKESVSLPKMR